MPPFPPPSAEHLQARLVAQRAAVRSLEGLARLEFSGPQGRVRTRQAVLAQRPGAFRLETLSPLGPRFVLLCDGRTLVAYPPGEGQLYRGAATEDNIAAHAGIPVTPEVIVDLLLASPPRRLGLGPGVVFPATQGWRLLVPLVTGGSQVFWFDAAGDRCERVDEHDPSGRRVLSVRFGEPQLVEGTPVPAEIVAESMPTRSRLRLRYGELRLNRSIPERVFTLEPPPGVAVVPMEAMAGYGEGP